uniref:Uncharacterized protein n=1 Tax=Strongyloides stercoralis TaxID=6248 RepID=A0A0K0EBU0_STRER
MLSFLFISNILYIYLLLIHIIKAQDNTILQDEYRGTIQYPTRMRMVNISPLSRSGVSKGIPRDVRYKNEYRIIQHGAPIKSFSIDGQPSRLLKELPIPTRSSPSYISTEGGTSKQKDSYLSPITVNEALKEDDLKKILRRTTMSPKGYQYKESNSIQTNTIDDSNVNNKNNDIMDSNDTEELHNEKQIRVPVPITVQEASKTSKYENEKKDNGISQTHSPKFSVMQTTQTPLRQAIGVVHQLLPPSSNTGIGNFIFPQNMPNIPNQGSFGSNFNNLDVKSISGMTVQPTSPPTVPIKNETPQVVGLQGIQQFTFPPLSSPTTIISTGQFTTPPSSGNLDMIKHAQEAMEAAVKANQIRPGSEKYEQKGCVWDIVSNSCKDIFNLKWCDKCEDFGNIFMHDCKCTIDHVELQQSNNKPISILQQTPQTMNGVSQQNYHTIQQTTSTDVLQHPLFNNQPSRTSFLVT